MIARLSSAVFYIITRKLLGAFYVDQKKKDLPPSTLPSEHKQWVYYSGSGTQAQVTLPISLANSGIVVGMDGAVVDIHYAAYVDKSTITVHTNTTGAWGFRAIIIGY